MRSGRAEAGLRRGQHSQRLPGDAAHSVSAARSDPVKTVGRRAGRWLMTRRSGQATVEFAVLYAGVVLPLIFMTIFVAEMLWIWHSVADFTRDAARYASTHCWMSDN